jgi:hypothetical protein
MNQIDLKRRRGIKKYKQTLYSETKKAVNSLIITLSVMIAILGIIFLFSTNQGAQKGYILEQEKAKNEYLKGINTSLTTKITKATAFSEIEDENNIKEMEEPPTKNYVTSEDNSVY